MKENMKWHEKQLKQTQYFLLVSGKRFIPQNSDLFIIYKFYIW